MQTRFRSIATGFANLICLYCAAIVAYGMSLKPVASDIAVVLGNEVNKTGEPSARLKARLDTGIDVYNRHMAKIIMVSGGVGKAGFDEAIVMANYLRKHGITQNSIVIDSAGINTRATAVHAAQLMQQRHLKSAIIVSQYFHLPRCILAFQQAGITQLSAAYPYFFEPMDILGIIREAIALPMYFFGGK
jgi:vancomycin permeability regulator SanA